MSTMVKFPETVERAWKAAESRAETSLLVRKQIEREVHIAHEVDKLHIRHEAKVKFQQDIDASETPPLEMMTLADYLANPAMAPADLIEGVMKDAGLCTVIGPSRSGKTTVALQMVHSLLTGADWLGQKVHQIDGKVGILSYDMDASMIFDWIAAAPNVDPTSISVVNAYRHGNPLGVVEQRQQIAEAWKAMGVEVVVLDSFSASFFGSNQNDAGETMSHYRDLKKFALTEVGAKVLIVILHSTDANPLKARGSTVHIDTADSMVAVSKTEDGANRRVEMVKYRAAMGQEEMTPVLVGKPDDVTHLVEVDVQAMGMANMTIKNAAMYFSEVPDTHEAPDTDSEQEDETDEG